MTARNALGLRLVGALLVLLGGAVHLQQWITVFRDQPIGPSFLVNAAASLIVAVALVVTDDRVVVWPAVAGLALSLGSLVALLASRTVGLPGFEATGYDVAEYQAIVVEALAALVLGLVLLVLRRAAASSSSVSTGSQVPLGAR